MSGYYKLIGNRDPESGTVAYVVTRDSITDLPKKVAVRNAPVFLETEEYDSLMLRGAVFVESSQDEFVEYYSTNANSYYTGVVGINVGNDFINKVPRWTGTTFEPVSIEELIEYQDATISQKGLVTLGNPGGAAEYNRVEALAQQIGTIGAGNKLLYGDGAPSNSLGSNGDSYIDKQSVPPRLYGPKASGAWAATYVVLGSGSGSGGEPRKVDFMSPSSTWAIPYTSTNPPDVQAVVNGSFVLCTPSPDTVNKIVNMYFSKPVSGYAIVTT